MQEPVQAMYHQDHQGRRHQAVQDAGQEQEQASGDNTVEQADDGSEPEVVRQLVHVLHIDVHGNDREQRELRFDGA